METPAKPWKPSPLIRAFLAAIRVWPSVTVAARAAGIAREAHYRQLERSPQYAAAFAAAMRQGIDSLEDEAIRRAQNGVRRPVMYHGKPVMVPTDPAKRAGKKNPKVPLYETDYSDTLMLAILKAKKPDEYREKLSTELTGKDGAPLEARLEVVFVSKAPDAR
jgi:hypothetical protein